MMTWMMHTVGCLAGFLLLDVLTVYMRLTGCAGRLVPAGVRFMKGTPPVRGHAVWRILVAWIGFPRFQIPCPVRLQAQLL